MGKSLVLINIIFILPLVFVCAIQTVYAQEDVIGNIPINFGIEGLLRQFQRGFEVTAIDPEEYVVAPGDEFTIFFTSNQIDDIKFEINASGNLFIKSVGLISIDRITLQEALERITDRVKDIYPKTDFSVQLTGFRIARINIIGEVLRPGIYYAPAIWKVSEVIEMAGGYKDEANIRGIKISGFGRELFADLIRFTRLGDVDGNPLICNGEVIEVPHRSTAEGFVTISGLVNHAGTFVYTSRDRLSDLIAFAGGLNGLLAEMEIIIASSAGDRIDSLDGASANINEWYPQPGDNIKLIWKASRHSFGAVDIFGAVRYPGRYKLQDVEFTMDDLLKLCGGVTSAGCPEMTQVFRKNGEMTVDGFSSYGGNSDNEGSYLDLNQAGKNRKRSRVSLNPREPETITNFELVEGDSLYVPFATGTVMVSGAVASPGLVKYREEAKIDYYIEMAGGYGFNADKEQAVIINPHTGGRISAARINRLFDGEIVFIPFKDSKVRQ